MNLPTPAPTYDAENESQARQAMQHEDVQNMKIGAVFTSLKFRDTVTGTVKTVTIASGAWVIT